MGGATKKKNQQQRVGHEKEVVGSGEGKNNTHDGGKDGNSDARRRDAATKAVLKDAARVLREALVSEEKGGADDGEMATLQNDRTVKSLLKTVAHLEDELHRSGGGGGGTEDDMAVLIDFEWGDCGESLERERKLRTALLRKLLHMERENQRLRSSLEHVDASLSHLASRVASAGLCSAGKK